MAEHASLSTIDPEFAALAVHLPQPPPDSDKLETQRNLFNNMVIPMLQNANKGNLPLESEYRIEDRRYSAHDGFELLARWLIPTPADSEGKTFPLFFWIHSGGFINGSIDMDDYYLRRICVDLQIVIVNFDYRLAPENPFPTGLNDCYTVFKGAVASASQFSVSLSKGLILGGQSAGSNYAAVIAHRARDDPEFKNKNIKCTGQLLQLPIVIHPDAYPEKYKSSLLSLEQNKDSPLLSKSSVYYIYGHLNGPPTDPNLSPLLFSHEDIPPTYIQVCGMDPFRDEGILYEKLLNEAGVKTKLDAYPGVPHGFHLIFPGMKASLKLEQDFRAGIKWLLKAEKD